MAGITQQLSGFFSKSKNLIGLDIGYDSVKGVELARENGHFRASPCAIVPVEPSEHAGDRRAATLAALRRMTRETRFSTKRVATAVSGENVIVRILRLPVFDSGDESLEFAVRGEARDFIPFDMDDVVFDYQKLGEVQHESTRVLEVLIVAVRKDVIEERLALVREAGLDPVVIDVGSFALCNALSEGGAIAPGEAVALVDIGAQITSVAILKGGVARFTRDLTIGGRNITEGIAGELEVDAAEAERLKCRYGILLAQAPESPAQSTPAPRGDHNYDTPSLYDDAPVGSSLYELDSDGFSSLYGEPQPKAESGPSRNASGDILADLSRTIDSLAPEVDSTALEYGPEGQKVSEVCEHFVGEIVGEVKRSLLYYENQLGGEVISRILLSGGTARMQNIERYFEQVLDIKCQRVGRPERVVTDGDGDEDFSRFGVGVGLSLRSHFQKS